MIVPVLACTAPTTAAQRRQLAALCGDEWEIRDCHAQRAGLGTDGAQVQIVYGSIREEEFPLVPGLRWVQLNWAGVEGLLFPAMVASPVLVTNVRGAYARTMSEHVLAGLLHFSRDLPRHARSRGWSRERAEIDAGVLYDSGVCVLGAGSIARVLCPLLTALGMRVVAINRTGHAVPGAAVVDVPVALRSHLAACRHLVILLPATPHTRRMVDADMLAALQPGGVVVNVGRGAVLDEAALLAALDRGHLRGAVLDSTDPEPPLPDSPLWEHPRVLLTGHRSCVGGERDVEPFVLFCDNLRAWLAGRIADMRCVVDKNLGY